MKRIIFVGPACLVVTCAALAVVCGFLHMWRHLALNIMLVAVNVVLVRNGLQIWRETR